MPMLDIKLFIIKLLKIKLVLENNKNEQFRHIKKGGKFQEEKFMMATGSKQKCKAKKAYNAYRRKI